MPVILAGIDEAGYGPLLGPLTVAMTVLRINTWTAGQPAPDCWSLLDAAVCRKPGDKRSRIPVGDSKKLKLPNDSATRHPLTHLERGVLAFIRQTGCSPTDDQHLLSALASDPDATNDAGAGPSSSGHTPPQAWYAGPPSPLPCAASPAEVAIDASVLQAALASAGVSVLALRCIVVDESAFNDIVRRTGTKGEATLQAIGRHLRWLRDELARRDVTDPVRVVCDRLGGRTTYGDLLARELPGPCIRATEEAPRVSRYEIGEHWAALFQPEAEEAHLPVALASMTAKLVRELSMARFNRHFAARMPELKPTAGYRGDAARWLKDAGAILTAEERREMVRIA